MYILLLLINKKKILSRSKKILCSLLMNLNKSIFSLMGKIHKKNKRDEN